MNLEVFIDKSLVQRITKSLRGGFFVVVAFVLFCLLDKQPPKLYLFRFLSISQRFLCANNFSR